MPEMPCEYLYELPCSARPLKSPLQAPNTASSIVDHESKSILSTNMSMAVPNVYPDPEYAIRYTTNRMSLTVAPFLRHIHGI